MPNAFDVGRETVQKTKKEEEGGLLSNIMSAGDFIRPDKLLPAVGGAALQQARALTTLGAAAAAGGDIGKIEGAGNSPLGFLVDVENYKKQRELANSGNEGITGAADKFNAVLGAVSPLAQNLQMGFAQTGLRAGGAVGSGISQTGAFGPRFSPNEGAEKLGIESYGQAAREGRAGALLLGDVLNVAPALKGASAGGALNPLAETAAASKISQAGAALERAPLAPYYVPARGAYRAFERGIVGADAFPKLAALAEKEIPVASRAAGLTEEGAQKIGRRWAGAKVRAEGLKQQGLINRAARQEIDTVQGRIDELEKTAPDSPELAQMYEARDALHSELKADAARETKYEVVRWAHNKAKELGVPAERLQSTNAFGKIINEVSDEMAQGVATREIGDFNPRSMVQRPAPTPTPIPEGTIFPEDLLRSTERRFAEPTPVLGQSNLFEQGISPETIAKGREFAAEGGKPVQLGFEGGASRGISEEAIQASRALEPASVSQGALPGIEPAVAGAETIYPKNIRESLKTSEKLQPRAVREIPEHFTDDSIRAHMRGLDAPTLPEGVGGEAVKMWDQMMTAWKTGVLPLRPAWHSTNIVGNVMGAVLMGEVSPIWFAQNIKRIMKEVDDLEKGHPSELLGASTGRGLGVETARDIAGISEKGLQGKVKRAAQKSYGFNQKVDDFSHVAVALHELDRQLAAGISRDAAVNAAEAFSLKTMGDFGNMSAGERSMVRRVLPFYPWYKHVSKATLRFPMENPGRFLQAQALANRLTPGQETPEGAGYLKGAIPTGGGGFLRIGGDIGLGVENNPLLDPTSTFQGAAPPIQWLGAAAGLNLARGRELQTAPGQSRASAIGGYAINQLPITKTLADLADTVRGQGGIVRGDTRAPIISGGRPIEESAQGAGFLPASAIQYLTGLNYQKPNLKAAAKREKKAEKTQKSKEKSYQKAVKKAPKK